MATFERLVWASGAVLAALLLQSIYQQGVGWVPVGLVTALALIAAIRPYDALLWFAAVGPLANVLMLLTQSNDKGLHFHEALTLAFLFGWACRRAFERRPSNVSPALSATAISLIVIIIASATVSGAVMVAEDPAMPSRELLYVLLVRDYLVSVNPITAAAQFVQGLLLLLAVADICAGEPTRRAGVLKMMVVGAAAAASLNLLRVITVAVAREAPWAAFWTYLTSLRVNVQFADLNAAGSYFALTVFIALAFFRTSRWLAVVCGGLICVGLWLTGSRTAMAAVLLTGTAGLAAIRTSAPYRRTLIAAGVSAVVVIGVMLWIYYPAGRNTGAATALEIRMSLARGALEMARSEPIFGVGVGRYYIRSAAYTLPGYTAPHENAHNNFLQILAELGLPGVVLFLIVIGLALWVCWRDQRRTILETGTLLGLLAYLLTCVGGHPLIVAEAAYPFWIALGVAASGTARATATKRRWSALILVAPITLAITLPSRVVQATRQADVSNASIGLSSWQHQSDGRRYRWAGGRSTFFIPTSAQAVSIPVKHGKAASDPLEVRFFLNGREASRLVLHTDDDWRVLRLVLPRHVDSAFFRIDIEVAAQGTPVEMTASDTAGALMVGRAETESQPTQ